MIGRILDASARHRALVLVAALLLALAGWMSLQRVELDAIPDLGDTQVVVYSEWMGRAPSLVEDQVGYPLVTGLLGLPRVIDVRAQSMFGMSFVYVVFEEGTDLYWARARVQEALGALRSRLPPEVSPRMGPDATGVGWVYQYALVDRTGQTDLGALRTFHDTSLRYALQTVPGVAEVATVGGYEPQYQVTVDPERLRTRGVTLMEVAEALRRANGEVGGRVIELSQREHFVRGRGWLGGPADLERAVIRARPDGASLRVSDVATVRWGPEIRRGAADLDGRGEVVSGIVVMRQGERARDVIGRVEARLRSLRSTLPPGAEVVPVYDRRGIIDRAIDTLRHALVEEMIVVALVIAVFLLHIRSALLPVISLPLAVLLAFVPMYLLRIPATIMSLGGIAIAIGATVDAEIVMVEAAHKALEDLPPDATHEERSHRLSEAAREVTPAIFFSLLIIAASFIPVFGLTGQAGRLFRPLAYTKTFVMLSAALLSITVAPALRDLLLQGKMVAERDHPVSRAIRKVYAPFVHVALRNPVTTVLLGVMAVVSALPLAPRLGREFMPPLDEGDVLYMPTTLPGISVEEARRQLQRQDAMLRAVPEVLSVLGKAGRAESPTDPAPLSMFETVVRLKPRAQWRTRYVRRWYVGRVPVSWRPLLGRVWPEFVPISRDELVRDLHQRMTLPGWSNAFTQPIRNRIDMQATGIRTPVGIKVHGDSLDAIEAAGTALERILSGVRGARSVFYERNAGGGYVDIEPDREALARHGLSVNDVQELVEVALGGRTITTAVEGRRRFPVVLRFTEDHRTSLDALRAIPVPLPMRDGAEAGAVGATVPLGEVARVVLRSGPPMIRDEGGSLVGYVYVDLDPGADLGGWVDAARRATAHATQFGTLPLPPGTWLEFTGQYQELARMEARMKLLVPMALLLVVLLLYAQFRNVTEVLIVLLSVPFALVGSVWALYLLDYRLSTAVWVGVIALVGLAAQTGVVMIVYIDHAYLRRLNAGKINSLDDIVEAHAEGTIQRVRPKLMTVGTMLVGLLPILWSDGAGADVMKRIAAPMVGGLVTSAFLTLEIIPVIYTYWRNEQRVWAALAAQIPARLGVLVVSARTVTVALGVASAAALAPLYLSGASAWRPFVLGGGVALAAAALLVYGTARVAAGRALSALPATTPAAQPETAA